MIADGRFVLLRTTLLDFPGKVAASVFLPGCHLRCPYCHNPELVDPVSIRRATDQDADESPYNCNLENLDTFLGKRAPVLGGLAVSGGEALLHPLLPDILKMAEKHNLPVKLDTAGLLPERLKEALRECCSPISYVAVDLKTETGRYGELGWQNSGGDAGSSLSQTLKILKKSGVDYELRTTVVPPLVDREVLLKLAPYASEAPRWIWQVYHKGHTLNPEWSSIDAPDEEDLRKWASEMSMDNRIAIR